MPNQSFFDPDEIDEIEKKHLNFAMKNTNVVDAFNQARTALFYRIRGQHRHARTQRMIRYYLRHKTFMSVQTLHILIIDKLRNS